MALLSRFGFFPKADFSLKAPKILSAKEISIVIPVKDNLKGINRFLYNFFLLTDKEFLPLEIIIVDNNSTVRIPDNFNYAIPVNVLYCSSIGLASARNFGIKHSSGNWILFTDSNCIPTRRLVSCYWYNQNNSIGYSGSIESSSNNFISKYYESQETLIPPKVIFENGNEIPNYLCTSNCLVLKLALEKVGGFDENLKSPYGEDIDLGFKLLSIGKLSYVCTSLVLYNSENNILGFIRRFYRAGKGYKMISNKYMIYLYPTIFRPEVLTIGNLFLAALQYLATLIGYKIQK